MNPVSKKLCLILAACSSLLLAGCPKKPLRPDPGSTAIGPQTGGPDINRPMGIDTIAPNTGLEERGKDGVIEDKDTIRGLIQPVYFDYDRSEVKASERAKLQEAKKYLDEHPGTRIMLEGHCDWRGTTEYNLGLGDRRATSAKRYLQSLGVKPDRIESNSKGSLDAAKGGDDAAMAKDRRADVVIIKAKAPGAMTPL